ncbi:complex I subunit 5 family protein [Leucobacter tardus]|uniref:NADH:quinone oxidoreductase/Mrp antiporter transmembrane domain-containing protein n=1 Tax=Leucobacter tardus TaxID=501483 RepID=A0A939QDA0_9MICO|nr:proton-conducting transporter membrane subunit [Leucobacter tardus]MBO2989686.1 hypothetical protein [Leucobacter tardus]
MIAASILPALVLVPLAGAGVVALVPPSRRRWVGWACAAVTAATAIALAFALAVADGAGSEIALGGWEAPLGITLRADGVSLVFLLLTAVIGFAVSTVALASDAMSGGPRFWPLWLGLWSGLNGVFVSGDLFNMFVMLELVTLAAVALVGLGGRGSAGAALRYLFVGVVGSLLFLLAVALVYAETGVLDLLLATETMSSGMVLIAVLALTLIGMGAKMALFPLHSWLPVAHPAAPAAVSAALSALVVKAAVFVLWRVWFALKDDSAAVVVLGAAAAVAGAVAVIWGSVMALRARRLKRIIAYSTVAQVGYFAMVLDLASDGTGLGDGSGQGWAGGVTLVLAHGLAKAAMFLAAGNLAIAYGSDRLSDLRGAVSRMPGTVAALAVAGVSLAALPPTFGFVAKWQLLVSAIDRGAWWWAAVLAVGGLLAFGYTAAMIRATFNARGEEAPAPQQRTPVTLTVVPLTLAIASVVLGIFSSGLIGLIGQYSMIGGGA